METCSGKGRGGILARLAGKQLFYIATGFGFTLKQDMNPYGCVFYLDDVKYTE